MVELETSLHQRAGGPVSPLCRSQRAGRDSPGMIVEFEFDAAWRYRITPEEAPHLPRECDSRRFTDVR
jgi:hypothetical protein